MLKRVKDNFRQGVERVKWFSTIFSERLKIEITIFKLLYQSDEMDKGREELLKTIGRRVYEMWGHGDKNILKDRVITEALATLEKTEKNIEEIKQKVSEIGGSGA